MGHTACRQKVCNHPKAITLTIDRERAAAAAKHAAAEGAMFIKLPPKDNSHLPPEARAKEAELRGLTGESLVAASGKLALLDRLLIRSRSVGSRVLVFSQCAGLPHQIREAPASSVPNALRGCTWVPALRAQRARALNPDGQVHDHSGRARGVRQLAMGRAR